MTGFKVISETLKFITQTTNEWMRILANTFEFLKPILAIFRSIYLIFEDIATYYMGGESYFGDFLQGISDAADEINHSFNNSAIGKLFSEIEKGMKKISSLQVPSWLSGLLSGAWIQSIGELFSKVNPVNVPPTDPNKLSYQGERNWNTSNNFSITTNQPMDVVADNLINHFTPTQVQYGVVAV